MTTWGRSATTAPVAAVVREAFGADARVTRSRRVGGVRERSALLRLHLDGPGDLPATVVAKRLKSASAGDPDALGLFHAELASLRFLSRPEVGGQADLGAPGLVGDSARQRVVVMEDLGDGASLADVLLASGAGAAPADGGAVDALHRYARSLGTLNGATRPHLDAFRAESRALGATDPDTAWGDEVGEVLAGVPWALGPLGLPVDATLAAELSALRESLTDPAWTAFTHGDPCPDNNVLAADGRLTHFDFEFAGLRHALVDGAYLTVPFPTCWCVGTLDPALQTSLERTYRSVLGEHLPAARDDAAYDAALLAVRAYWALRMVTWLLPKVVAEDRDWGRATIRQRVVLRVRGLVDRARDAGEWPATAALFESLLAGLAERWGDVVPMDGYPALEAPPTSARP